MYFLCMFSDNHRFIIEDVFAILNNTMSERITIMTFVEIIWEDLMSYLGADISV